MKEGISEAHDIIIEKNIKKKYNEYKTAYKKFYEDENYDKEDALNEKRGAMNAANWGVKATAINKKIKQYKTFQNQKIRVGEKLITDKSNKEVSRNIEKTK